MNNFLNHIYIKSQENNFHTNTLGLTRSLLALSTLLIILLNPTYILFHTGLGVSEIPNCNGSFLSTINFFCVFSNNLILAKTLAVLILLFVISGYFPKITGILHWWLAFSVNTGLVIIDGGGQVASILTFMLIPLTLTDNRQNHWNSSVNSKNEYNKIISYLTVHVIKFQVAFIYFDSAMSKISAPCWTEGTALYYFINDPITGVSGIRQQLINSILNIPFLLVLLTYTVIILEILLGLSLFFRNKKIKISLFKLGVLFHILIFFCFGIFTFVIAMFSALIILFIPLEDDIKINYKKTVYGK